MAISNEGTTTLHARCDFCSFTQDTDIEVRDDGHEEQRFFEAVAFMKQNEWKIFKDQANRWRHKCPSCLDDERLSKRAA